MSLPSSCSGQCIAPVGLARTPSLSAFSLRPVTSTLPVRAPVTREPFPLYRPYGVWVEVALTTYQCTSLSLVFVAATSLFAPARPTADPSGDYLRCPRGYSPLKLLHAATPRTVCQSDLYALLKGGNSPLWHCILGALGALAFVLVRRARNAGVSNAPQLPRWLRFLPDTQIGRLTHVWHQDIQGQAYHAPIMFSRALGRSGDIPAARPGFPRLVNVRGASSSSFAGATRCVVAGHSSRSSSGLGRDRLLSCGGLIGLGLACSRQRSTPTSSSLGRRKCGLGSRYSVSCTLQCGWTSR